MSVVATIQLGPGYQPYGISSDGTNVWVANNSEDNVSQISISSGTVVATISVGVGPSAISSDGTYVWVANFGRPADEIFIGTVSQISISSGTVVATIVIGESSGGPGPIAISSDGTYVWVANFGYYSVSQISISSGTVVATISVGDNPTGISSDGTYVWVSNFGDSYDSPPTIPGSVSQISISSGTVVATISLGLGSGPRAISSDGTNVWVANELINSVSQISISSGTVVATIPVGSAPSAISSDGTNVWVANYNAYNLTGSVSQISIFSGTVVARILVGESPYGISSDGRYVWVANSGDDDYGTITGGSVSQIMINNTTNYYIDNLGTVDLNTIFALNPGGMNMNASATGFIVNNFGGVSGNNVDLANIFQPYTSGVKAQNTGYVVNNGLYSPNQDLANIFQYLYS